MALTVGHAEDCGWVCGKCTFENMTSQLACEICNSRRGGDQHQLDLDQELARLLTIQENNEMNFRDELLVKAMVGEEGFGSYFGLPHAQGEALLTALRYPLDPKESSVAIFHSESLFKTWMEQSSYSCGATSVANVLNALQRKVKVTTQTVLNFYIEQTKRILHASILRVEQSNKGLRVQNMFGFITANCFGNDARGYYDCTKSDLAEYAKMWLAEQDTETQKPVLKKLKEILRLKKGLMKLKRKNNPHTSIVGSVGIRRATEAVASKYANINVVATVMVQNSKTGRRDWERIKKSLKSPRRQLIFHLTNHYAPIYAAREFLGPENRVRKQILTARNGQRPSAWLDWDTEVLEIIGGWPGYNIMEFELCENGKARALEKHAHPMESSNRRKRLPYGSSEYKGGN